MSFALERQHYFQNSKKLRRARKLYKFLIAPAIFKNPQLVYILAVRAIDAGLYARSNNLTDVVSSLWGGVPKRFNMTWYGVCNHCSNNWFDAKRYFRKNEYGYYNQIKKIRIVL